jgi:hypothetical protein
LVGECWLQEPTDAFDPIDRMMVGIVDWSGMSIVIYATSGASGGLGKTGLITVIVVSIIAIIAFVWIFRETGGRD